MRARDLGVIAGTAVLTAALVCGTLTAIPRAIAGAGAARLDIPSITMGKTVLAIESGDAAYKADETPVLRLLASSSSSLPEMHAVNVRMTAMGVQSAMSRMAAMPVEVWQHELLVRLSPNQARTLEIRPDVALRAGVEYTVILESDGKAIRAAGISIPLTDAIRSKRLG